MDEESAVIAWARSLLLADSTFSALIETQVYDSEAPEGTVGDYVTLHAQSWTEIGTNIVGELGMADMMLTVKAVTQRAGFAQAAAIFRAANSVLHRASGSSNGADIKSCRLETRLRYPERKDGVSYQHLGGMYRVKVSAS